MSCSGVLYLAGDFTSTYTRLGTQWVPQWLSGQLGIQWKTKEITWRVPLLHMQTRWPKHSLQIAIRPPDPSATTLGVAEPRFWYQKAKERPNQCGRLHFHFCCRRYIEWTYYVASTHIFLLLYLTYFLWSVFMVCIKHMFLDRRNELSIRGPVFTTWVAVGSSEATRDGQMDSITERDF